MLDRRLLARLHFYGGVVIGARNQAHGSVAPLFTPRSLDRRHVKLRVADGEFAHMHREVGKNRHAIAAAHAVEIMRGPGQSTVTFGGPTAERTREVKTIARQ